jgi:hypothetical protein
VSTVRKPTLNGSDDCANTCGPGKILIAAPAFKRLRRDIPDLKVFADITRPSCSTDLSLIAGNRWTKPADNSRPDQPSPFSINPTCRILFAHPTISTTQYQTSHFRVATSLATGMSALPPNSDRESDFPQTVMSALPPKADMCSALAHVRYGPIADSCTAANSPIRSPRELWQSTRIGFRRSILSWETSRDPVSGRSRGRTSSSPLGQSAKQVRSGVSSRPATSQLRSMSFGSHPCRAPAHRVCD